jgi:hypothetical protein
MRKNSFVRPRLAPQIQIWYSRFTLPIEQMQYPTAPNSPYQGTVRLPAFIPVKINAGGFEKTEAEKGLVSGRSRAYSLCSKANATASARIIKPIRTASQAEYFCRMPDPLTPDRTARNGNPRMELPGPPAPARRHPSSGASRTGTPRPHCAGGQWAGGAPGSPG